MSDQLSSDLASLRIDREAKGGGAGKRILLVLALIAAAGGVAWAGYPRLKAEVFKPEVALTEVSMISPVQSSTQVTATGYIVPQVVSKVGAHSVGRLARVLVKEGDAVKAGQVIAELDAADQRSAVVAAGTRIAVAQANVATAEANLEEVNTKIARERPLVSSGAESKSILDDLVTQQAALQQQVKAAQANVTAAQAEQGTLGVTLRERAILAPIDGVVVTKPMKPGEVASPGGDPIAEIVDFKSLLAEVDVPENRLSLVKIGGPCEIVLDAYPDKRYRGEVVELGKRLDRSKATLVVKVKFTDDMSGVLPEMSARVGFLTAPVTDEALKQPPKKVVSVAAVVDRNGRKVVLTVEDGVVRSVPVTTGAVLGSSVELLDGPASGARVVATPTPELTDGAKVKEKGSS